MSKDVLMPATSEKSSTAFRTISEVAAEVGVPQHVLRFWETRFPQIEPVKRGGNRRYYRPADVALLQNISRLLYKDGYTIKGVQQLLARGGAAAPAVPVTVAAGASPAPLAARHPAVIARPRELDRHAGVVLPSLPAIRAQLAAALAAARAL